MVGHGLRERMLLGPRGAGEKPEITHLRVRRYLCRCGAVINVVPRGVGRRLRYRLSVIGWALGRWFEGSSASDVRHEASPFRVVGHEAQRGWHSLRRWTGWLASVTRVPDRGHDGLCAVVQRLAVRAIIPSGHLARDAAVGITHMNAHQLCTP